MLSQTCARRELGSSCERLDIFAGTSEGALFGGYARLVGAPNCAPSLRSVAGLLLALALQSRLRAPPPTSLEMLNARRILLAPPRSGPSAARHRRVCTGNGSADAGFAAAAQDREPRLQISTGRRGGCPRRGTRSKSPPFGRASAPQRRACEDTAPKRTSSSPTPAR